MARLMDIRNAFVRKGKITDEELGVTLFFVIPFRVSSLS